MRYRIAYLCRCKGELLQYRVQHGAALWTKAAHKDEITNGLEPGSSVAVVYSSIGLAPFHVGLRAHLPILVFWCKAVWTRAASQELEATKETPGNECGKLP